MADLQNKLTGNYYIAWLSRCDDAWRRRIDDQGPYVPQHTLKKQHHADCQQIAKDLLREQLHDKMQAKRLGLKSNPGKRHSAGFASRAQQRWAFGTGQSFARRWARKTKFKGLPERVTNMPQIKKSAVELKRMDLNKFHDFLLMTGRFDTELQLIHYLPRPAANKLLRELRPGLIAKYLSLKSNPRLSRSLRRYSLAKYAYDVIAGSRKRPQGWVGTYRTAQEARREGTRKGYSFYVKRIVKSNSRLSKLARSARKRVAIKRMLRRAGHRIPAGIMFRTGALRKYRRRKLGYNARDPVAYRRGRAVGHLSHSASYPAPSPRAMRMYGASFVAGFKKGKTRRSRR